MIIDISKPQIGDPNIQIWTPDNVTWDLLTLKNDILSPIHETYSPETHYESIPGELTESDRSYITVTAKKLIAYIYKGQICNSCKYFAIAHVGLDFHHVNPKDKLSSIHEITRNNGERGTNSLWGFLCELDKTIPLCKICHSSFHNSLRKPKKENCIKKLMVDRLGIRSCMNCGTTPPLNLLDGHHRNPCEKSFELARVYEKNGNLFLKKKKNEKKPKNVTLEQVYDEIDKCDILCKICHSVAHFNLGKYQHFFNHIVYRAIDFINSSEKELYSNKKRKNIHEGKLFTRGSSKKPIFKYDPNADDFFKVIQISDPRIERVNPFAHIKVQNDSLIDRRRKKKKRDLDQERQSIKKQNESQ